SGRKRRFCWSGAAAECAFGCQSAGACGSGRGRFRLRLRGFIFNSAHVLVRDSVRPHPAAATAAAAYAASVGGPQNGTVDLNGFLLSGKRSARRRYHERECNSENRIAHGRLLTFETICLYFPEWASVERSGLCCRLASAGPLARCCSASIPAVHRRLCG